VLKGPQAMFYGKSATAGVIALRTRPIDQRARGDRPRAGYDFESLSKRGEAILSGPRVSDTLKLRLSTMYLNS